MKRAVIGLLCAILCFSAAGTMSGCGGEGDYVLTIGYEKGGLGDEWLKSSVKAFCAREGIDESKVLLDGSKGFTETIESKLDSGTGIRDVYFAGESTQRKWAARGWLEPLDDLYEMTLTSGKKVREVVTNDSMEMGRVNNIHGDHYYLFPWTQSSGGLYYNKTLFDENDWEVPTTFEGLKALAKQIYREKVADVSDPSKQVHPFVCSADVTSYWDFLVQNWWVQLIGIDEFKNFCKYDTPELYHPEGVIGAGKVKALQAFEDLIVKNPAWTISDSADYLAAQMLFVQGRAAMIPNGAWLEAEMKNSLPDGMEISYMPTPFLADAKKDEEGNPVPVLFNCSNDSILVPKEAKHKDLAKKFIAFLCEPDQVRNFVQTTGTPRPIEFDVDALTGLTACQQSVIDTWKSAQNFTFMTTSKLSLTGQAQVWKLGFPYSKMLFKDASGKVQTAEEYCAAEYNYVKNEWAGWLEDADL